MGCRRISAGFTLHDSHQTYETMADSCRWLVCAVSVFGGINADSGGVFRRVCVINLLLDYTRRRGWTFIWSVYDDSS